MFVRGVFIGSVCAFVTFAAIGAEPSPTETGVDVSIVLDVGGHRYAFTGKGECTHEPVAFIYGVRAQQWTVGSHDARGSASLTLWLPAAGSGDMFTFHATTGGTSHVVSTVKTSGGGTVEGSGTVTFTASGAGGTFTIDATTAKGGAVTGVMKCSRFSAAVAEGG